MFCTNIEIQTFMQILKGILLVSLFFFDLNIYFGCKAPGKLFLRFIVFFTILQFSQNFEKRQNNIENGTQKNEK